MSPLSYGQGEQTTWKRSLYIGNPYKLIMIVNTSLSYRKMATQTDFGTLQTKIELFAPDEGKFIVIRTRKNGAEDNPIFCIIVDQNSNFRQRFP